MGSSRAGRRELTAVTLTETIDTQHKRISIIRGKSSTTSLLVASRSHSMFGPTTLSRFPHDRGLRRAVPLKPRILRVKVSQADSKYSTSKYGEQP